MDSAPRDGTAFVAVNVSIHPIEHTEIFRWEDYPNYWHCKKKGICIRPDYQDRYLWSPLPSVEPKQTTTLPENRLLQELKAARGIYMMQAEAYTARALDKIIKEFEASVRDGGKDG